MALRIPSRAVALSAILFAILAVERPGAISAGLVISQVYGGGGNAGAPLRNDFIELFNRGTSPVSLAGMSVQYAAAAGTAWQVTTLPALVVQPGQYVLVQESAGAGAGVPLPAPDATGTIAMSATAAKVALVGSTVALSGGCPTGVIDLIGYGGTASCFETANAGGLSNTTAALRAGGGCTETDNNGTDFTVVSPAPRNSASPFNPCAGAAVQVSQSGASTDVIEGGPADSYTIALSAAPSGPVEILATADPQLEVSTDSTTFAPTATVVLTSTASTTVFVRAIDDGTTEPAMTVNVTHSITSSGDPAYSNALTPVSAVPVNITDNDIVLTPISAIQGPGSASPLAESAVTTTGVVYALKSNGFFIQEPDATVDGDPQTSEGIFVFTSAAPTVTGGDLVQVSATVAEFVPGADPNQPPLTELSFATTSVLSTGNPLPAPSLITAAIMTALNAVELLERLEGMRVSVPSMTVVAPTLGSVSEPNATATSSGVFYAVVTGVARPFREAGIDINDPLPPGAPCCVPRFDGNPERLRVDSDGQPGAAVLDLTSGVTVTGTVGPLDYGFRTYTILPDAGSAVAATPNSTAPAIAAPRADEITVVGWNLFRFFDTIDDAGVGDPVLTAAAFENRLKKASLAVRSILRLPDVIGAVEVENLSTLQTLATRLNDDTVATGGVNPNYIAFLVEGNDVGGIDVGFLVKGSRISVLSVTQEGDAATFVDPTDGSTDLLNDRPPLVLSARATRPNGSAFDFIVVNNHLRSLNDVNDAASGPRVRAKRAAQAEFLADLIQDLQLANPGVKVMAIGDFNAFEVSDGYVDGIRTILGTPAPANQVVVASTDLVNPNLTNLLTLLPFAERYSYSFDGNAQVLDHALASAGLMPWVSRFTYTRLDADYPETTRNDPNRPERLSDHEATVTYLALGTPKLAGTIVDKTPRAAGQMTITLRLSNTGGGNAVNVVLNPITFRTLAGTGTVTSVTPVPLNVGGVPAGQFKDVAIVLNVPASVTRFSVTEAATHADAESVGYKVSMTQSVIP